MSSVCLLTGNLFIPVTIKEDNYFEGVIKLIQVIRPQWCTEDFNLKIFTDGITNKLIACSLKKDTENKKEIILVRIYGNKTDLLIDRKSELRNIETLNKVGLAPNIYCIFENGFAYEYYPGVTLNVETVVDIKIWHLVARQMAKMHKVVIEEKIPKEAMLWDKTEQFLSLLPEPFSDSIKQKRFVSFFGSVTKLRIEYERLKSYLMNTVSPIVFAHNDLLLGNVIFNEADDSITFIDFEYAAYNYQAFDIANHFNEFVGISVEDINYNRYPPKDFQLNWLRVYLEEFSETATVPLEDIETLYAQVEHFSLASHFFWGIWSLIQYEHSHINFDFGKYAAIRLGRYYELKDKVFKKITII